MQLEERPNATSGNGLPWVPNWLEEQAADADAQPTLSPDMVVRLPKGAVASSPLRVAADPPHHQTPATTRPLEERATPERPDPLPVLQSAPRLLALLRTTLLDTPPNEAFDRLTQMAAELLDVPVSIFTLLDDRRQFNKSQCVMGRHAGTLDVPLSHSFCKYVVATGAPLLVSDALSHPWVYDNPAVHELHIAAYAGVPIFSADGQPLGAFCAVDIQPHTWAERDVQILQHIAHTAMTYMNLRTTLQQSRWLREKAERAQYALRTLLEASGEGIAGVDAEGVCTFLNATGAAILGVSAEELVGKPMGEYLATVQGVQEDECPLAQNLLAVLGEGAPLVEVIGVLPTTNGQSLPVIYSMNPMMSGEQVTGAVFTFRDVTERQQTRQLLALEAALGRARAESATAHNALGRMVQIIGPGFGSDWCALWVPDQFTGALRCMYTWACPEIADTQLQRVAASSRVEYGKFALGVAWRNCQLGHIAPSAEANEADDWRSACQRVGLRFGVAVPLRGELGVVGVLESLSRNPLPECEQHAQSHEIARTYLTTTLERRTIELSRHGRAAMASAIFEHAPYGMLLVDANGAILDVNPVAERLLVLPLVALVGITFDQLLTQESQNELQRLLAGCKSHQPHTPFPGEACLTFQHPDGHQVKLLARCLAIPADSVSCVLTLYPTR